MYLEEGFEYFFHVLVFDACTIVFDTYLQVSVCFFRSYQDLAFSIFDGIGNQITDNFINGFGVDIAFYIVFFCFQRDFQFVELSALIILFINFFQNLDNILPLEAEVEHVFFYFAEVQQLVDQFEQSVGITFYHFQVVFGLFIPITGQDDFLQWCGNQ